MSDDEVVVAEEFNKSSQRQSFNDLQKKYKTLKDENKTLGTKVTSLLYANDALHRKLFEQDQRWGELARHLGFDNIECLEATITSYDPWIPGAQVALSEARARILLLEDELAKHIATSNGAQAVLTETTEQLNQYQQQLDGALGEAKRLREERDTARQIAKRQVMEAEKWRAEVQTTLPEMQNLIRELQQKKTVETILRSVVENGKENNVTGYRRQKSSPFRDLANTTSPTAVRSSPPLETVSDAQDYKQRYELLHTQYKALLDSKEKVSKRYREALVRWKNFKQWLVKDQAPARNKSNAQHRILRRRKVMEEIGPQVNPHDVELGSIAHSPPPDEPAGALDITLVDPPTTVSKFGNDAMAADNCCPSRTTLNSPVPSGCNKPPCSPPQSPLFGKGSSQASNLPPALRYLTTTALTLDNPVTHKHLGNLRADGDSASQESLTQPSSLPSISPVHTGMVTYTPAGEEVQSEVLAIDSSPERNSTPTKRKLLRRRSAGRATEEACEQQVISPHLALLGTELHTPMNTPISHSGSELLPERKRLRPVMPIHKYNLLHGPGMPSGCPVRRSVTVLATDTPPRARTNTIIRHHSSPPDSPYIRHLDKGKRKAIEMEGSEDENRNHSDPFSAGPSTSHEHVRPTAFQTREEKTAHLKALNKKPQKEYMAEYMQFKGRGRYSNVNAAADKTINGEFEIDPEKNDGLNFQYDAVERDKAERKRMGASDCECCRDYYDAIGPLPPRLQAPLWRSPSSDLSSHPERPCRYKNKDLTDEATSSPSMKAHTKAVEAHKQEISRHRHSWAPPNTPPDFWKIGFPDTQTVEDINRRANELHARKYKRIETEAKSHKGQYRERK